MSVNVEVPEPLAGRLAAEAARRGLTATEVAVEALEGVLGPERSTGDGESLARFIGCGSSGRVDDFDIEEARADLAKRKLAEGA